MHRRDVPYLLSAAPLGLPAVAPAAYPARPLKMIVPSTARETTQWAAAVKTEGSQPQ